MNARALLLRRRVFLFWFSHSLAYWHGFRTRGSRWMKCFILSVRGKTEEARESSCIGGKSTWDPIDGWYASSSAQMSPRLAAVTKWHSPKAGDLASLSFSEGSS
ncbi:hypothetical protein AVEN_20806-1 [Araneus ventricosus]|uniref:Secreted protein n=1 Tax=Araneus ventricosus TaxID=182803 RepID=A0A4Y2HX30_ARAVE|nr:hypothetical protein AVEN_20806-1 [Araneus ventricosus]